MGFVTDKKVSGTPSMTENTVQHIQQATEHIPKHPAIV
jgi:hypothetical protein